MDALRQYPSDVAFTPAVKVVQARKGSRAAFARMEQEDGWRTAIDADLTSFIAAQISVFLATASADGQPYMQHRGGPPGFLHVLDERTIAFADFAGNRQYLTLGNLSENPKAHLFLIDYARRRRIKVWGTARVVEDDPALVGRLMPQGYRARGERAILFTVAAWDMNCPQHIPQRFEAADVPRRSASVTVGSRCWRRRSARCAGGWAFRRRRLEWVEGPPNMLDTRFVEPRHLRDAPKPMSWLTVAAKLAPHVASIAHAVVPVFTTRRAEAPAIPDGTEVRQQIAELQDAARANAENIRKLAADLQDAIAALEQAGQVVETRMRRIELMAYAALAVSVAALVAVLVLHR